MTSHCAKAGTPPCGIHTNNYLLSSHGPYLWYSRFTAHTTAARRLLKRRSPPPQPAAPPSIWRDPGPRAASSPRCAVCGSNRRDPPPSTCDRGRSRAPMIIAQGAGSSRATRLLSGVCSATHSATVWRAEHIPARRASSRVWWVAAQRAAADDDALMMRRARHLLATAPQSCGND
jgi:hypothetical protein